MSDNMYDENQVFVPPSFAALYSDARGRLRATQDQVRERYSFCEDLACHLVEQAQTLYHEQAPSEFEILRRFHTGLSAPESGMAPGEATWVVSRLAELLEWQCPDLPDLPEAPSEAQSKP